MTAMSGDTRRPPIVRSPGCPEHPAEGKVSAEAQRLPSILQNLKLLVL